MCEGKRDKKYSWDVEAEEKKKAMSSGAREGLFVALIEPKMGLRGGGLERFLHEIR